MVIAVVAPQGSNSRMQVRFHMLVKQQRLWLDPSGSLLSVVWCTENSDFNEDLREALCINVEDATCYLLSTLLYMADKQFTYSNNAEGYRGGIRSSLVQCHASPLS